MNKLFRLLFITLFSKYRSKIGKMDRCITPFWVMPTDLDVLRHMNNGIYLSLQDLARVDYMIRSESMPVIEQNGWYPVVTAETIQFKKSLQLFDEFTIETQVLGWTEKHFILEHVFKKYGETVAFGLITARFLKKSGGTVEMSEFLQKVGIPLESPPLPDHVQQWLSHQQSHAVLYPKPKK